MTVLKRSYLSRMIFAVLIAVLVPSFVATAFANEEDIEGFSITDYLKWPDSTIHVCWEDSSGFIDEKRWVKDKIISTWGLNSGLDFVGWNDCASSRQKNIRIRFDNSRSGPHVKFPGGITINNKADGVVFWSDFDGWKNISEPLKSAFACCLDDANRRHCTEWVAVHEFGHALAVPHEHNRLRPFAFTHDGKGFVECDGNAIVLNTTMDHPEKMRIRRLFGNRNLASYDPDSVMNYCYTHEKMCSSPLFDIELSEKDILSLHCSYGHPDPSKDRAELARSCARLARGMPVGTIPFAINAASRDYLKEFSKGLNLKKFLSLPDLSIDIQDLQYDIDDIYASETDHPDAIIEFLNERIDLEKETPLMYAAAYGYIDVVKELLRRGDDSDAGIAIMYALQNGHGDIVKLFLEYNKQQHKEQGGYRGLIDMGRWNKLRNATIDNIQETIGNPSSGESVSQTIRMGERNDMEGAKITNRQTRDYTGKNEEDEL